jgi:hypothetical protein
VAEVAVITVVRELEGLVAVALVQLAIQHQLLLLEHQTPAVAAVALAVGKLETILEPEVKAL